MLEFLLLDTVFTVLAGITAPALEDIDHRFNYHKPDENKATQHEGMCAAAKFVATHYALCLPEGREKSLALTKLEEAMFWANASLARNP